MKQLICLLLLLELTLSQVFSGYGRNKIQYNEFEWQILKTMHFDIYYYPEMEELTHKAAFWAEESYRTLEAKFNHTINRRIPLILYSTHIHFQQSNVIGNFIPEGVGGFFEFLKGRVVIPGNGNLTQFRKVIRHELVHVFMHAKLDLVYDSYAHLSPTMPPLWFVEGLAEFYSGNWDYNGEMILKDAVLNNYLPSIEEMSRISGSYVMYKVGEKICHYIAKNYGEEKIIQILENSWRSANFTEVLGMTLNEPLDLFSKKYQYAMKKEYYPLLSEYDFSDALSQTIEQQGYNQKPVYDPQTKHVYFWSNRSGYTGIYRKEINKINQFNKEDDLEVLLTGEKSGDFESFHPYSNKFSIQDSLIYFSSKSQGKDHIYIYSLKTEQVIDKINLNEHIVSISSVRIAPDNSQLVFSGLQQNGYSDLYLYHLESKELSKLTDDFYDDIDPVWTQNGSRIIFSSDRGENGENNAYNLFEIQITNHRIRYLTHGIYQDFSAELSPSGDRIAFISTIQNERNIYILPYDEQNDYQAIKLTKFTSSIFDLSWIDEDQLVFTSLQNMQFKIQKIESTKALMDIDNHILNDSLPTYQSFPWKISSIGDIQSIKSSVNESNYAIDIAQSNVTQDPIYGTRGGAMMSISDVLGDNRYDILLFNSGSGGDEFLESFSFHVARYHTGSRLNIGYGIFRFYMPKYDYRNYYQEESSGADLFLQYPFDQYNRIEWASTVSKLNRDYYSRQISTWVHSQMISYVKDNSLWDYLGPIDGERLKFSLGYSKDFIRDDINFFTFMIDARKYFRVSQKSSYAVRAMTLINKGKENRLYAMGGSWDLRGYRFLSLRGDHLFLLSQEYRFPLMDFVGLKFSFGPAFGSNRINGAFFLDYGNASTETFDFENVRGAVGLGIRINFMGGIVFRWDYGHRISNYTQIESNNFLQFFFGWDF